MLCKAIIIGLIKQLINLTRWLNACSSEALRYGELLELLAICLVVADHPRFTSSSRDCIESALCIGVF